MLNQEYNKKDLSLLLDIVCNKNEQMYIKLNSNEITIYNQTFSISLEVGLEKSEFEVVYAFDDFKRFVKDAKMKNHLFLSPGRMTEDSDGVTLREINCSAFPCIDEICYEPISMGTLENARFEHLKMFDKFRADIDEFDELNKTCIFQESERILTFMVTNGYTMTRVDFPINQRFLKIDEKYLIDSQYVKNLGVIFEKKHDCDVYLAENDGRKGFFFTGDEKTVFISGEPYSEGIFDYFNEQFSFEPVDFSTLDVKELSSAVSGLRKQNKIEEKTEKDMKCMFNFKLNKGSLQLNDSPTCFQVSIPSLNDETCIINAYDCLLYLKTAGDKKIGKSKSFYSLQSEQIQLITKRPTT